MLAPDASGTAAVHAPTGVEPIVARPDCPLLLCHATSGVPVGFSNDPANVAELLKVELPSAGVRTVSEMVGAGGGWTVPLPETAAATAPYIDCTPATSFVLRGVPKW